jgi:hypothetical protein
MYQFKGFFVMPALANNGAGSVGIFGELSPYSQTFSEQRQDYDNPGDYPAVSIVAFKSTNDVGQTVTINSTLRDALLGVGQFLFEEHVSGSIPTQGNAAAFRNTLVAEFPQFVDIAIGTIVDGNIAGRRMPVWVELTYVTGGTTYTIKIWTSDQYFRNQYDEFKIYAIPPVAILNNLNNSAPIVQNLLLQNTANVLIEAINQSKQFPDSVHTALQTFELTWNDPSNNGATLTTYWTLVIYGQAGIDTDVIKDAIRIHISTNSNLTNWGTIYPDLYSENEFIIVPLWDNLATPDNSVDIGLYSGFQRVNRLKSLMLGKLPVGYSQITNIDSFLNAELYVMGTTYRSMQVLILGNPNNQNGIFNVSDLYPDYINVPTTSPDFGRMEIPTAQFANTLVEALEKARIFSSTSPTPIGYTKVRRGNDFFLSFVLQGFKFLVMTKESFLGD